jgi:penicillin-binding protein 1A
MREKVAVYSSKKVRGQIIAKTLSVCGIQTEIVEDRVAVIARVERAESRLVVVDVNSSLADDLSFVQDIAFRFPEFVLVVHNNPMDLVHLMKMGLRQDQCLGGPLDPEAVFLKVDDLLKEIKAKYGYFNFPKPKRFLAWRRKRRIRAAKNHSQKFNQAIFRKSPLDFRRRIVALGTGPGLRLVVKFFLIPMILLIGIAGGYLYWIVSTLPDVDLLSSFSPYKSSRLYSYDNILLSELYIQRRTPVPLGRVPGHVKKAFVAIEDARYFEHSGIDPLRIIGALYADIKAGEYQQGGSTITQQLAKMIFLKPEKTLLRKIREIAIALRLERKFTKDQILEFYLNQAYFGSRAYGIQAAAEAYFGKEVDRLTLAEGAMLAALPKGPSVYSPFQNPEKCLARRKYVLERMQDIGVIDKTQYSLAVKEPLPDTFHGRVCKAPYFVDYCTEKLKERFGDQLFTGGLQIYSTLDYRIQQIAEEAVRKGIADLESRGIENVQAALVAIDVKTGGIRAIVGGSDYEKSEFNRATQAMRQPGSAFKPIVYLTALLEGYSSGSMIQDKPVTLTSDDDPRPWTPKNYSGNYRGEVTLKQGLALSLNAATVDLAIRVGIRDVLKTAERLGIKSRIHPVYSSVLGASETTLLELVSAYSTLATGRRVEPECVERVIDKETMSLQEPSGNAETVIDQSALSEIRTMLKAVVEEGTARKALSLNRTVYGKTGTTNNNVDALFIGFDDRFAVGVWVGKDNRESIGKEETGARAALPIWIHFMEKVTGSGTVDAEKDLEVQIRHSEPTTLSRDKAGGSQS